jgi:hypothetical protein
MEGETMTVSFPMVSRQIIVKRPESPIRPIELRNVAEIAEKTLRLLLNKPYCYSVFTEDEWPDVQMSHQLVADKVQRTLPVYVHVNPDGRYAVLHINGTHGKWALQVPSCNACVCFADGQVKFMYTNKEGKIAYTVFAVAKGVV